MQGLLHFAGQFIPAGGDQLSPCVAEPQQLLPGREKRLLIVSRARMIGFRLVVVELRQRSGHFALCLQQQALRIAGELAGREQVGGGEADQLFQARA